jgi:O-methyltransferase
MREAIDTSIRPVAHHVARPLRLARSTIKLRRLKARFRRLHRKYRNYTMTPEGTYVNVLSLVFSRRHVAGCVAECGVWRGGVIAGIAELLGSERHYFLFDSFEGLPAAEEIDGPALLAWQKAVESPNYHNNCTASQVEADAAMRMSKVASYSVVKGWFDETLPRFTPPCPIAILRLDGDLYSSMRTCLINLWPYLAPDGVVIIDDYNVWDGCARAVHEFLADESKRGQVPRLSQYENDVYMVTR